MPAPYDYASPLLSVPPVDGRNFIVGQNIGTSALQAQQQGLQNRGMVMEQQALARDQTVKQQALQMAQQQAVNSAKAELAFQAELDLAAKARDPALVADLMVRHPERAEKLKASYAALGEIQKKETTELNSVVHAALMNDAPDVAIAEVKRRADALRATRPDDAAKLDTMAKRLLWQPDKEFARVGGILAAIDPDKYAENALKVGKQGADIRAAEADADKKAAEAVIEGANAAVAPERAGADLAEVRARTARLYAQTKNEAAKLALDERKLASDVALAREKMKADTVELPPAAAKARDDSIVAAVGALQAAESTGKMAAKFRELGTQNGVKQFFETGINGQLGNYLSGKLGMKDEVAALRTQFRGTINKAALADLPAGPASDKDVALVRAGFESEFGDFNQLADALDAMERIQRRRAQVEEVKAEWQQQNRALTPARGDIVIGGRTFPAGMSLKDAIADVDAESTKAAEADNDQMFGIGGSGG